jgi:hypothetical protein
MLKSYIRKFSLQYLATVLLMINAAASYAAGQLPAIESETLDGKDFIFPKDLNGEKQDVLFLSITETQENGMAQQEQLLKWEEAIRESGGLPNQQSSYYLVVMESPPFFVKGFIRKDMKEKYGKRVALNHLGILFIDDMKEFTKTTAIASDGEPTVVVADKSGKLTTVIKGAVTPEKLQELKAALQ